MATYDPGRRDRRVSFEENLPLSGPSSSGAAPAPNWRPFYRCWAEKKPVPATRRDERFEAPAGQLVATADVLFQIAYPKDPSVFPAGPEARITPRETCRLVDETGRPYDIVRVSEPPGTRHRYLDVYAFARGE